MDAKVLDMGPLRCMILPMTFPLILLPNYAAVRLAQGLLHFNNKSVLKANWETNTAHHQCVKQCMHNTRIQQSWFLKNH